MLSGLKKNPPPAPTPTPTHILCLSLPASGGCWCSLACGHTIPMVWGRVLKLHQERSYFVSLVRQVRVYLWKLCIIPYGGDERARTRLLDTEHLQVEIKFSWQWEKPSRTQGSMRMDVIFFQDNHTLQRKAESGHQPALDGSLWKSSYWKYLHEPP